jgi:hypothetical protein
MIPDWYKRMNPRERVLAWVVAGTAIVLLNLLVVGWLFGALGRARTELAARKTARAEQAVYVKERDLWIKRDQWTQQHQPILKNPAEASILLDQMKQVAAKYNVLIQNPAIGSGETTPNHQTVFASIETKSPWPPLVHFLYDVQQPDAFVVFENINLAIDSSDPTMMVGKFKIARWFAPAQRPK